MAPSGFTVKRTSDTPAFAAYVTPWLLEREPEHNVLLGLLPKLASAQHEFDAPIYLATVEHAGAIRGCVFRTPPYKLGLTRFPEGAEHAIALDVGEVYDSLPAALGRVDDASRFADAWCRLRGGSWTIGMRQRIHSLEALVEPTAVASGTLRLPTADERSLMVAWITAFADESGVGGSPPHTLTDVLIRGDDLYVWDDRGAAGIVAAPGFTPNGARVGYVYTPPERRGHGYATAAVAELSRRLLAEGRRFCMLYTDVTNATSNGIYARLGYRPVTDVVDVDFAAP